MERVPLTGLSGTGKSAVIRELAALGHAATDRDEGGVPSRTPRTMPSVADGAPPGTP